MDQQAIQIIYDDGKPIMRVFLEDSTFVDYRLRETQLAILIHDAAGFLFQYCTVRHRD